MGPFCRSGPGRASPDGPRPGAQVVRRAAGGRRPGNSQGCVSPRQPEQDWRDRFDRVHRELDYAVLPITLHPDVSGRPQVLLMLERFVEYVAGHEGVSFCTLEDAADDFRRRFPFDSAERPADLR
ncbi:hypothetical protein [Streptomyces sp. NBC_01618]|uniref:hypothetical protein n=1 Tax=Streptomyces sp. NBC_01618 TaxID=2975900 RepID=UPI0038657AE7|nr:hypothetical protein OH735_09850 [Streptomyces sp. NBC_01618]